MSSAPVSITKGTPDFQSLYSRTWILASFYIAVALSIPFWIKTTTIERLALPRQAVAAWEAELPCPVRLPQSVTLLLPPGSIREADEFAVAEGVRWSLRAAGDGVVEQRSLRNHYAEDDDESEGGSDATDARQDIGNTLTPSPHAACLDWSVRVGRAGQRKMVPAGLYYEITFVANSTAPAKLISTSTSRQFEVPLPRVLAEPNSFDPSEISSILASYLARLLKLPYAPLYFPAEASLPTLSDDADLPQAKRDEILRQIDETEEDRRRVPYTRNIRLVFSLINEDVSASEPSATESRRSASGVRGWDRSEVEQVLDRSFDSLSKALSRTQTINKELQTIWFAPLPFEPKVLEYARKEEDSSRSIRGAVELPGAETIEPAENGSVPLFEDEELVENLTGLARGSNASQEEISLDTPSTSKIDRVYLVDWEDLKIFVDAGEWSLTSGSVTSPLSATRTSNDTSDDEDLTGLYEQNERTLHFILYVPKPSHRPLRIAGDGGATIVSDAKGWLIPQWGGVSLFNLGFEERENPSYHGAAMLDSLSAYELEQTFATFEKQLVTLLGLQQHAQLTKIGEDISFALSIDTLTRRRIVAASRESVKTLGSIVRLVDKIENLGVGPSVRDDVSKALQMLERAKSLLSTTDFDRHTVLNQTEALLPLHKLLHLAHSSELLSSRAFFNPNMLGLLYFPDEHKYAVYMPLFGPLAVPLLVAAARLLKERRRVKQQLKLIAVTTSST